VSNPTGSNNEFFVDLMCTYLPELTDTVVLLNLVLATQETTALILISKDKET
jgi:hypothetical protein